MAHSKFYDQSYYLISYTKITKARMIVLAKKVLAGVKKVLQIG